MAHSPLGPTPSPGKAATSRIWQSGADLLPFRVWEGERKPPGLQPASPPCGRTTQPVPPHHVGHSHTWCGGAVWKLQFPQAAGHLAMRVLNSGSSRSLKTCSSLSAFFRKPFFPVTVLYAPCGRSWCARASDRSALANPRRPS